MEDGGDGFVESSNEGWSRTMPGAVLIDYSRGNELRRFFERLFRRFAPFPSLFGLTWTLANPG